MGVARATLTQMTSALKRRTRWGRWTRSKPSKRCRRQIANHPFSKWKVVVECEGKFGPTTTEIMAALKAMGKEALPDYPSKELKALIPRDRTGGGYRGHGGRTRGARMPQPHLQPRTRGVEEWKGKGEAVEGEEEEAAAAAAAAAHALAAIAEYAYMSSW
ncbi:hypothetical protein CYMTET_27568 [Cymbomonas tetramitiformis]|uniref:Uncharacterized protein n=1 Tax=Cymbomonas tetramitiformis TaxID=36881 RepID=A0AAE0FQ48_9CHLO|nr:hypothetical protein CYMTET_27568 [Cymbomonas tetramitiformis]